MKSLQEIKDQYARELYPNHDVICDWYSFTQYFASNGTQWYDKFYNEVTRRANIEVATASLAKAAENAKIDSPDGIVKVYYDEYGRYHAADTQSITSPDNIVTL